MSLDYTQILLDQLASRGLNYSIVGSHTDADLNLSPFGYTATDHDVVIARTDVPGFEITGNGDHTFANNVVVPGLVPLSLNRGYVSVDASLDGLPFEFISTHLNEFDIPGLNQAQVGEIIAWLAGGTTLQLVVGDFNSTDNTLAYADMVAAGFIDAADAKGVLGPTCCQAPDLSNTSSELSDRIDYIFERNFDSIPSALLVGNTPFEIHPPLWPSDHAGLVATVSAPEPPAATIFLGGLLFLGFRNFSVRRRRPVRTYTAGCIEGISA